MPTIAQALPTLERHAPLALAAEWDNVGLLLGDPAAGLSRLMTCLTITEPVVDEAVERRADLVVAHHPLPFRPLRRITTDTPEGARLWRLAGAGVAVYSAHTAFDSAADGINELIASGLGLTATAPLEPADREDGAGVGRVGDAPPRATLASLLPAVRALVGAGPLRVVGADDRPVRRLAVVCGSGGSLIDAAVGAGADAVFTGEASFHDCLKCEALGVAMILAGHYASERFAVERLAERLAADLEGVECWASHAEADPLRAV